jgi:hypothetical protein
MPQITAAISNDLCGNIKKIATQNGKSFSMTVNELIQNGIKMHQNQQGNTNDKKMSRYEKNHHVSLMVALNLIIEVLKKMKNESSEGDKATTDYIVDQFKNTAFESLKDA